MISKVKVLHSFIGKDGLWVSEGSECDLDADFARSLESSGYVDVLSTDGMVEVWAPCCTGDHDH